MSFLDGLPNATAESTHKSGIDPLIALALRGPLNLHDAHQAVQMYVDVFLCNIQYIHTNIHIYMYTVCVYIYIFLFIYTYLI